MTIPNHDLKCSQAEAYYYDFLKVDHCDPPPKSILKHIENCRSCQEKIEELRKLLQNLEQQDGHEPNSLAKTSFNMLCLQLSFAGQKLTCSSIKPFLPLMLNKSLGVRVPTPITVHIDNCLQCQEDLEVINQLGLDLEQSQKLSLLFVESTDIVNCEQVESAIKSVAMMNYAGMDAQILSHICKCSDCHQKLYEERQKIIDNLESRKHFKDLSCEHVGLDRIFDFCFPFGAEPYKDSNTELNPDLISHLKGCRTCLEKIQEMHRKLCNIIERPESGVVTVYSIDKQAENEQPQVADNIYAGFPIKISVLETKETSMPVPALDNNTSFWKQKISFGSFTPLAKAAAAVIIFLVFVNIFFNTQATGDTTVSQIYDAIEKIKNVHIVKLAPGRREPVQERWISRKLNIYVTKTGDTAVLWNIDKEISQIRDMKLSDKESRHLDAEQKVRVEKKIGGTFSLMPFESFALIPEDAKWQRVDEISQTGISEDTEMYELSWTQKGVSGVAHFCKWRVLIDAKSKLPQRTEFFSRSAQQIDYDLISISKIEYLSDHDMKLVIERFSF